MVTESSTWIAVVLGELGGGAPTMTDVGFRFVGCINYFCDVFDINGQALEDADDQMVQFLGVTKTCGGANL